MRGQRFRIALAACANGACNGRRDASPIPPLDIIVISMNIGKTSATPATASEPRELTK
jgi:hypothetical protein